MEVYDKMYNRLIAVEIDPVLQRLGNEGSENLIKSITNKRLTYQLISPYDHQLNPAERVI